MKAIKEISGKAYPFGRKNVDTDVIIPAQWLKTISREGLGVGCMESVRKEPGNVFEDEAYKGSPILIAGDNFGCGSSREHAVWALNDFGIRVLLAPSFADIFFNNCFKNGLLPIVLPNALIEQLFNEVEYNPGYTLTVDLASQTIRSSTGMSISFDIDETRKHRLLEGLDDIGITLQNANRIRAYEARQRVASPWLFN